MLNANLSNTDAWSVFMIWTTLVFKKWIQRFENLIIMAVRNSPDARSGSVMENRRLAISEKNFVAQS
jgi:hypothetical protein